LSDEQIIKISEKVEDDTRKKLSEPIKKAKMVKKIVGAYEEIAKLGGPDEVLKYSSDQSRKYKTKSSPYSRISGIKYNA
jgi:hypothetical protein